MDGCSLLNAYIIALNTHLMFLYYTRSLGKRINIIDPIDSIKSSEGETNDFNDPIFLKEMPFTFLEKTS